MRILTPHLLTILCLFSFISLSAQQFNMEAGLFLGAANYGGDLGHTNYPVLKETQLAHGGFLRYRLGSRWALRANVTIAKISGDDLNFTTPEWRQRRAISFKSNLTEVGILAEWSPLERRKFERNTSFSRRISPYLFAGVGGVIFDPNTNFEKNKMDELTADIEADQLANVTNARVTIPFGMGVKFNLTDRYVIGLEGGLRPGFTDYLDGVSQAGNPNDNDWYGFAGMTMTYRFGEQDTDKDGIADSRDACPELPGLQKGRGCPDTDGDGLTDNRDKCPLIAGPKRLKGCPDSDGDGIVDSADRCPNEAGKASLEGCPFADSDGDGIADDKDLCPEIAGRSVFTGCPDSDGDGIGDGRDECPDEKGPLSNNGCPLPLKNAETVDDLSAHLVYFSNNSALLDNEALEVLNEVYQLMEKDANAALFINGYADANGRTSHNASLSSDRATACFNFLLNRGISADRMKILSFGEAFPAADNNTETGRQLNRRVELLVQKLEQ